jgi:hypothetical protein
MHMPSPREVLTGSMKTDAGEGLRERKRATMSCETDTFCTTISTVVENPSSDPHKALVKTTCYYNKVNPRG